MKNWMNNSRFMYIVMLSVAGVILCIFIGFNLYLDRWASGNDGSRTEDIAYTYHLAMISADPSDAFWETMYGEAVRAGAEMEEPVYPEDFGAGLTEDYTAEELVRMAVAARVDGIVVEADMTEEMCDIIEEASKAHIPVVTLMDDAPDSPRISYVGANTYTMGEMYGREVLEAVPADGSSVAVLVPANEDNMNPSYVYSGISSAIAEASKNIDVFTVRTGEDRDFVSEETVRNLLLDEEKRPDVLVCLSAVDTISAYQCVRDYNLVGQVKIIGTYVSTEILEGIGNGVIQSTIVVDAREAGQRCMQAMSEYMAQRYTNEYFPLAVELINRDNVDEYIDGESGEPG